MLYLIFTVFILAACQTTSFKVGNLDVGKIVNQGVNVFNANTIDEQQEIQFGENMSAVLLGARPLYDNKAINIYVNQVGLWLASNSAKPNLPWHFGVIDSSSINAFAAPGGYVFITSAMLQQLDNEAQLAAVLAHEIIHVIEQHHLNALKEGALRSAITESLFVSIEAYQANTYTSQANTDASQANTDASQANTDTGASQVNTDTGASQKNTDTGAKQKNYKAWGEKISNAAQGLYSKGLNREDEYQADKQGIRLLARAGYDPFAFIKNLQLLEAIAPSDTSLALLYKTHPTPSQRLMALNDAMNDLSHVSGQLLVERFNTKIYSIAN